MLFGANLTIVYWAFAFYQFIIIKNACLPRRGASQSADHSANGTQTDLSPIRTFGCRVWTRHSGAKRKGK